MELNKNQLFPRPPKQKDKYFKIRNVLNIVFILMVLLTIALYFIFPLPDGLPIFFSSCLIAILVKACELYFRVTVYKFRKPEETEGSENANP